MTKITASDPAARSADLAKENLRSLKALFPEAVAEGKIDFDVLRDLTGTAVEDGEEKFGLTWHGKRRARQLAITPSLGTLRPIRNESVDWETTKNLMIEGDNLEVLKLLQRSYAAKVKLIYIDPPYNTGKDFIYPDDYRDNIRNYLELTGQADNAHRMLSSNKETSGRYHTDWLNMLYPRLKLSRNLLTEDGVILISIDDQEIHHLRSICDEIFGDENFCGTFVWEKKKKPSFLDRSMGTVTDYIVSYARDRQFAPSFTAGTVEEGKKYPFNNAGNGMRVLTFPAGTVTINLPDGLVQAQDMSEANIKTELLDHVQIQNRTNSNSFRLRGEWRYSQSKLNEYFAAGAEILISRIPFRPNYVNRSGEHKKTANLLSYRINAVPTNEDATQEARALFGEDVVSYPKPGGLIKYLIRAISHSDDLILDFFAGSGTTASGVWRQNLEDSRSRRFIMVQLPESIDSRNGLHEASARFCKQMGKPANLAELTKEWLRRSGESIQRDAPLLTQDFGFRVFRLDSSNIRSWEPNRDGMVDTLLENVDHLKSDRSDQDVLYEVFLRIGLDLCAPVETRTIAGAPVHSVDAGRLFVCLADKIARDDVWPLALGIAAWNAALSPAYTVGIFRESAFADDVVKSNLIANLRRQGFEDVRSL